MQVVVDIKEGLKKWNTRLGFVSGLLLAASGLFMGMTDMVNAFLPNPYRKFAQGLLIFAGIGFLVWNITSVILQKRVSSPIIADGDGILAYSRKWRTGAQIIKWGYCSFSLVFIGWSVSLVKTEKEKCRQKAKFTVIMVARFSNGLQDELAQQLVNYIAPRLEPSHEQLENLNFSISLPARLHAEDSLAPLMGCYKNGLLIFGSRNLAEKSFYCNVFVYKLLNPNAKASIVTIDEPFLIECKIGEQCDAIRDFVLAILEYNRNKFLSSIYSLNNTIAKISKEDNRQWLSFCYLLKASGFERLAEMDSVKTCLEAGHRLDEDNQNLLNNYNKIMVADRCPNCAITEVPGNYQLTSKTGISGASLYMGDKSISVETTDTITLTNRGLNGDLRLAKRKYVLVLTTNAFIVRNSRNTWDVVLLSADGGNLSIEGSDSLSAVSSLRRYLKTLDFSTSRHLQGHWKQVSGPVK